MTYTVKVLKEGYSTFENGVYKANGTSTLILGPEFKVVVDTLSAWDREYLLSALAEQGVSPGDITHVVNTHGHPDHVGNNNLFTGDHVIRHIMGHAIHNNDTYFTDVSLQAGETYNIEGDRLQVCNVILTSSKTLMNGFAVRFFLTLDIPWTVSL